MKIHKSAKIVLEAVKPAFKHLSKTYEPDNPSAGLIADICEAIAKAKGGE